MVKRSSTVSSKTGRSVSRSLHRTHDAVLAPTRSAALRRAENWILSPGTAAAAEGFRPTG